jgi:plasmid maintenance system antidote protein VapI
MNSEHAPGQRGYNPDYLLETLIGKLNLKNDAALSRALEVSPPMISKIRHRRLPVTASLLIRMHEVSDLSIMELRALLGDRRNKFRISEQHFKPKSAPIPAMAE